MPYNNPKKLTGRRIFMDFNPQMQLAGLLEWMNEMMQSCHGKTAVIGISGGKDSSTVGRWLWRPTAGRMCTAC